MSTYTTTSTYTVTDVENVMRNVKTDLIMIAASSEAMSEDDAAGYAHDIELLAKKNHLKCVDVTLLKNNVELKAARYDFAADGSSGTARPGGVLWPRTPKSEGGVLRIHLTYTDESTVDSRAQLTMKMSWVKSNTDISHQQLSLSGSREYSSNGFGSNRKDFS
jgi:hypothetical protein